MKKRISIIITLVGIILFIIGFFIKVPNKELTTYSFLSDDRSVIEEYVGGDAYNYIIGASLIGGEISGAKTQKAIFISIGLLIASVGLLSLSYSRNNDSIEDDGINKDLSPKDSTTKINDEIATNNTSVEEVDKSLLDIQI